MKMLKIKDMFDYNTFISTNGFIINKIYTVYEDSHFDSVWLNDILTASRLDDDYYFKNCDRYVAPSVIKVYDLIKNGGGSEQDHLNLLLTKIAYILKTKYAEKWERLFKMLEQEHDGLNNIDYTETETPDEKESVNTNISSSTTQGQTGKIYGFNSVTAVDSGKVDNTSGTTTTGDYTKNYRTRTGTITKTFKGRNKDVQELIKSEVELLHLHDFYDILYNDISFDLALGIY